MPSNKPQIILDVNEAGSGKFLKNFPNVHSDLRAGRVHPVRGGKKYRGEVRKCHHLVSLFNQLKASDFVFDVNDALIDASEATLNQSISQTSRKCQAACDDAHLFALAKHSSAKYAITSDTRIAICRKQLSKSHTPRAHFSQLGVIKNDKAYLKLKRANGL